MEDDVDAPDGVDLDSDVDMERDGDNDEEEDDEEEDEEKEEEEEVDEEDEEEEEDKDEDDGKEPRTIGPGEMVNSSADDTDTIVDDVPTVQPGQGQEMREHTQRPHAPAPAPRPPTPAPLPRPQTPVTQTLSGLESVRLVTPQKPRLAAPTLRGAEAAGNTLDVAVEQQLIGKSAGGDCLPDVPLMDVPHPDVSLPHVPLPDVPLPEARRDGTVGEVLTRPHFAEEACVWVRVGFLSCVFPLL